MGAILEVKYFNTFWLKKLTEVVNASPQPTAPYAPVPGGDSLATPAVPKYDETWATDWYIEESRIRGGYNNTTVDFGVKAYLDELYPAQQHRPSALIYSGIFNSRTGINQTNQFSVGEDITKSTDPANGSIQRLYAEDTNLIIFQEDKVSRALIDKDAIYSAEGNAAVTSTNLVIGQIVAYAGEYGISTDPFSFAVYGYRKYFTDKKRGCVLRLSKDGITEISSYGMHDFFRDNLATAKKIVGSWDTHNKNYVVSLQDFDILDTTDQNEIECYAGTWDASSYGPGLDINMPLKGILPITDLYGSVTDITAGMTVYNKTNGLYYGEVDSVISSLQLFTKTSIATQVQVATFSGDQTSYIKEGLTMKNITSGHEWDYLIVDSVVLNGGNTDVETTYPGAFPIFDGDIIAFYTSQVTCDLVDTIPAGTNLFFQDQPYSTTSFDESVLGWTSFYQYKPNYIDSLLSKYYSFFNARIWLQNSGEYANYYGIPYNSDVTIVLNNHPSVVKNFKTINYEGADGWQLTSMSGSSGDITYPVAKYTLPLTLSALQNETLANTFKRKENKFFANIVNNSSSTGGEVVWGADSTGIKGFWSTVKMTLVNSDYPTTKKELFAISSEVVESSY
jgi:hypothetical protein